MNQVTNLIQHKNLKQEQKDDFDFEKYDYVFQGKDDFWYPGEASGECVHRLVIVDDKWYTVAAAGIKDGRPFTALGSQLEAYNLYRILRPARKDEIPQDERTLERKIEDKWPDKEVVMLTPGCEILRIVKKIGGYEYDRPHIYAQSVKGFHKYVYELLSGKLELNTRPIMPGVLPTLQPVAVLFERSVK